MYSLPRYLSLKAPTQIGQTVINKHFVWSVALTISNMIAEIEASAPRGTVIRCAQTTCDNVMSGTNPSLSISYAIAITHLRFVSPN